MECNIEKLNIHDLKETLELVKKVFMEFEAPDYSKEGIENFFKFANYESISKKLDKDLKIYVAKLNEKIIGMIAFSGYTHITLLFVDRDYQRKGIATKLIKKAKDSCIKNNKVLESITVNSSPYAKEFYHKLGFKDTGAESEVDGIKYTPMKMQVQIFK